MPVFTGMGSKSLRGWPAINDCCTRLVFTSAPEPTCFSPTWIGSIVRGVPRKAATSASESTRYLPSLTVEIAYITTKNASSSVMRSAYGIAHASWFVWSSCCCLRLRDMTTVLDLSRSVQIALELRLDRARILALCDGDHSFDDHLAHLSLRADGDFQLRGKREKEQICERDAVDRRSEGRSDSLAELRGVGQVLHDGDEPENRADDTERRRIDAHALEHFRPESIGVLARVELDFHDAANDVGLAAVDDQLQRLAHESVFLLAEQRLEPEQTLLAGDVAPLDHLLNELLRIERRRLHGPRQDREGVLHDRERRLHANRGAGADDDDNERLGRYERHDAGATHDGAADEREKRERETNDAQYVQGATSCAARRALHPEAREQRIDVLLTRRELSLRDARHGRSFAM